MRARTCPAVGGGLVLACACAGAAEERPGVAPAGSVHHMWECGRPDPSKPGAGFPVVSNARHIRIYTATRETGAYSHHSRLHWHAGRFYAMWSNHRFGEDGPGQRVLWSSSVDGETWEQWREVFPPPVPMVPSEQPGLVLTAGGWRVVGGRLFALAACQVVLGFEDLDRTSLSPKRDRKHIARKRQRCSRLAREVHGDGTLGPVFAVGDRLPDADQFAFRFLPHTDPSVSECVSGIHGQDVRRRLPEGRGTNRLCEPTVYRAADGTFVLLMRDDRYSHRMYVSFSEDGVAWPEAVPTDIPDSPSLSQTLALADGTVLLVGNQMAPEFDNPGRPNHYGRDPLMVSVSPDGRLFTRAYALRCGQQQWRVPRSEVRGRGGGGQYPSALVHDGMLHVLYSMGKEDIWVSRVPLSDLGITGATAAGVSRNLLRNPGFEERLTQGGEQRSVPAAWELHVYTPPDIGIVLDRTTAHTGENSVKIVAPVPRPKLGAAVVQSVRGIRAGACYTLSGWVLLKDLRAGSRPGAACLQLNFCDKGKQRLKLHDGGTRETGEWHRVSVTGTAPAETEWVGST